MKTIHSITKQTNRITGLQTSPVCFKLIMYAKITKIF